MKIAIDVFYTETSAKIVAALVERWTDHEPAEMLIRHLSPIAEYISEEFYKRELPCIAEALSATDLNALDTIIIDGYVYLNDDGKPGLGAYLYHQLNVRIPVIGVAKPSFIIIPGM